MAGTDRGGSGIGSCRNEAYRSRRRDGSLPTGFHRDPSRPCGGGFARPRPPRLPLGQPGLSQRLCGPLVQKQLFLPGGGFQPRGAGDPGRRIRAERPGPDRPGWSVRCGAGPCGSPEAGSETHHRSPDESGLRRPRYSSGPDGRRLPKPLQPHQQRSSPLPEGREPGELGGALCLSRRTDSADSSPEGRSLGRSGRSFRWQSLCRLR